MGWNAYSFTCILLMVPRTKVQREASNLLGLPSVVYFVLSLTSTTFLPPKRSGPMSSEMTPCCQILMLRNKTNHELVGCVGRAEDPPSENDVSLLVSRRKDGADDGFHYYHEALSPLCNIVDNCGCAVDQQIRILM